MDKTIDTKHAFKCLVEQHGVRILHYHCNNGRFADKAFVDDVRAAHQTITFCGISTHHQNGAAERHIRDITKCPHLPPACSPSMAQSHSCQPMATSHQACRYRAQFSSTARENLVTVVQVLWNICSTQPQAFPPVWLPSLHTPGTSPDQESIPEVGKTLPNWHFLMPLPSSCILRPGCPVNPNRVC